MEQAGQTGNQKCTLILDAVPDGTMAGQFRFSGWSPGLSSFFGVAPRVTEEGYIVNQDEAMEVCQQLSSDPRVDLRLTAPAAERLRVVSDESPISTPSWKDPFEGFQWKRFQRRCVNAMDGQDRVMLQLGCGLGKSWTSMFMALQRYDRGECNRIVVWCPASLVTDWVETTRRVTDLTVATVNRNQSPKKRATWYQTNPATIWVLNYERVRTSDREWIEKSLKPYRTAFVLDEITKVAHRSSSIHKEMAKLANHLKVKVRIGLTATPIVTGPENFYNEFRIIDRDVFGNVRQFEHLFTRNDGEKDMWGAYIGYQNLPYMHLMAGSHVCSITKTRPEVAAEFPRKQEVLVPYRLDRDERALYDEIRRYGRSLPPDVREAPLFLLTFQRLLNCPRVLLRDFPEPPSEYGAQLAEIKRIVAGHAKKVEKMKGTKMELAAEIVEQVCGSGEKLIIFAQHTENCLFPLSERLGKWKPLLYVGGLSPEERDSVKDEFKRSPDRNLLLMSDAGQVGLNFQECRYLLHYQTPTSHAMYEQRSDRCLLEDSQIYTPNGFKNVQDVVVGDRVFDAFGRIVKVTDCWSSHVRSRISTLRTWGSFTDLRCTSDHRVLMRDGSWRAAEDCRKGDWTFVDYSDGLLDSAVEYADTVDFESECANHNVSPMKTRYTHSWMVDIGRCVQLDSEFGFLIGYYLGDGFVFQGRCVRFAYNTNNHKADDIKRISSLLEGRFGLRTGKQERGNSGELYCYGLHFAKSMLEWFGTGCRKKHIPDFVYESRNREFLSGILDGMVASDGYVRGENGSRYTEYSSTSQELTLFFWWLVRRLGMKSAIRVGSNEKYGGRRGFVSAFNYVHFEPGYEWRTRTGKIRRVSTSDKSENVKVYDLTTESGSFVSDGIPVHNCHRLDSEWDSVTVYRFVGEDTVEERIEATMQGRREMSQSMGFSGEYEELGSMSEADADFLCGF